MARPPGAPSLGVQCQPCVAEQPTPLARKGALPPRSAALAARSCSDFCLSPQERCSWCCALCWRPRCCRPASPSSWSGEQPNCRIMGASCVRLRDIQACSCSWCFEFTPGSGCPLPKAPAPGLSASLTPCCAHTSIAATTAKPVSRTYYTACAAQGTCQREQVGAAGGGCAPLCLLGLQPALRPGLLLGKSKCQQRSGPCPQPCLGALSRAEAGPGSVLNFL